MKFVSILLLIIFILLSLLIFALNNIVAFKYLLILVLVTVVVWTLHKIRYQHSKIIQKSLWALIGFTILLILKNLYIMQRGIYLDGGQVVWINGQLVESKEKQKFVSLLSRLKKQYVHVQNRPTYSINFTAHGDFDPRHLHIFRDKRFLYQGCLLGLENGLDLEGYQLTKEVDEQLEEFSKKYSW